MKPFQVSQLIESLKGDVADISTVQLKTRLGILMWWNTYVSERAIAIRREIAKRRYTA